MRPDAKRARPDASRPGARNQIASLHLHLLEHQTHRKHKTQKIIFADEVICLLSVEFAFRWF